MPLGLIWMLNLLRLKWRIFKTAVGSLWVLRAAFKHICIEGEVGQRKEGKEADGGRED